MASILESVERPRSSRAVWLLSVPIFVLALLMGWLVWEMDLSIWARLGYFTGFALIGYWLYTPKSPRHIMIRQIVSMVLLWSILVVFLMTWAFQERDFDELVSPGSTYTRMHLRLGWGAWILVYAVGAALATRRIYRSLDRNIQLTSLFSRYVAPAVIVQMLHASEDFFDTRKAELSVLFLDLRGFTATSSRLAAEQVRDLINIFMGVMIPVAHAWRGTVDKTVGDEIMVLFGAPILYPDHADQAVKTAMALLEAHKAARAEWEKRGLPILEMGIGINTGEMVVGNIGCRERVDYTVLGHHVNLGARLCGKAAGSQILISEFTRAKLSVDVAQLFPDESNMRIEVKGIDSPVRAYAWSP